MNSVLPDAGATFSPATRRPSFGVAPPGPVGLDGEVLAPGDPLAPGGSVSPPVPPEGAADDPPPPGVSPGGSGVIPTSARTSSA
jgi:hypothetical protein